MTTKHGRSKRKPSGAKTGRIRKTKKGEIGRDYIPTVLGERKIKIKKGRNKRIKLVTLSASTANIIVDGKAKVTRIISVIENPADSHLVRRNIITKGAIIETELGKAIVTSRPGQNGIVNARIIEKKDF